MTQAIWQHALAVGGLAAAVALAPPTPRDLATAGAWVLQPTLLPFAWQGLLAAERGGDAHEAFARAQQLMRLVPGWADGFAAFAYRYALAEEAAPSPDEATRGASARARLELAMGWLASARATAGRHEPAVLMALAFLPEVAARQEPALEALLAPRGGAAAIADGFYAELEQRFPSAATRDQRTFLAPALAAGLLAAGQREAALDVLRTAIDRSRTARDQTLAGPWRDRLAEALRWLGGDHGQDLAAVRADTRMAPLVPHLR